MWVQFPAYLLLGKKYDKDSQWGGESNAMGSRMSVLRPIYGGPIDNNVGSE